MNFYKTKTDCINDAIETALATMHEDRERMQGFEKRHYSDREREELAAQIADLEAIRPEAIEALREHIQRSGTSHKSMLRIVNDKGRPFNVRRVDKGDKYGREDCLTHDEERPMVEFYDASREPKTPEDRGQFVSRYYIETLINDRERLRGGLDLMGYEPAWKLDGVAMDRVFYWIERANGGQRQDR